jgi:Protein of unknown function (DUF3489)
MTTFMIDPGNNITAFAGRDQAEAIIAAGAQPFTSSEELAGLTAGWPTGRLVELWNSFADVAGFGAGLKPVKKFENREKAVARIWQALQRLNGDATAEDATAVETANAAPKGAKGTPAKGKSSKKATPAKNAAKPPKAKAPKPAKRESGAPREGSKTAQVVAMLQRKNGATLSEIMEKMGWQAHTVRGFMAGALKGAGYEVESFKPEGGERTYRINTK